MRDKLASLTLTAAAVGALALGGVAPATALDATSEVVDPSTESTRSEPPAPAAEDVPVAEGAVEAGSIAEGELGGELTVTAAGTVEFSVQIPEGMTAVDLSLPELRCPANVPFVEDRRFESAPDSPVALPSGLQAIGNAKRVGSAVWAQHSMDAQGVAVALAAGSAVALDGLRPADGAATFALHCTSDPSKAIGLGRIAEPSTIRIGAVVQQRLTPQAGVWISEVRDLPQGLELDRSGALTGRILPTAARDQVVTVVLTNGLTSLEQRITLRIEGETLVHLTRTWTVKDWGPISLEGPIVCPTDHPWTTAEKFHSDDAAAGQLVPRGVQIISHGWAGVDSAAVYQGTLGRGMTNVRAWNRLLFGIESSLHFRLHCTNDSNQASRR